MEHEEHLVVLREHEELREHPMRNKVFQEPDSSDFEMGMKTKNPRTKSPRVSYLN